MADFDFLFVVVFFLILFFNKILFDNLSKKYSFFDRSLMNKLYWYHLLFFIIYFIYGSYNPTDSKHYFKIVKEAGDSWLILFDSGTKFVSFVAAPLVELGFTYLTTMLFFSWMGFIGFVYAYLFFKENIKEDLKLFGRFNLLTILLFLPNMHFWTVSLGKGSIIFMGLMLFTQAIRFPKQRFLTILIGAFFVYMVRPHVMLFVLVGVMIGLLTGKDVLTFRMKALVLLVSMGFLYQASNTILSVAQLENSENIIEDFEQFSQGRSTGLSENAGSGVAMNNYPLPFKFFTFWFRPLFVDSPGFLGFFSSIENLFYLFLFLKICNKNFIKFIKKAPYVVKMSLIVFLLSSFAMTFVMSNLGIIMRQKSQVMYFGFFVIYFYLADKKIRERNYWKQINADTNQEAYQQQNKEFIRFK